MNKNDEMNIIVTGATGAIGYALTKELLLQKHTVIAAYRNNDKAESLKEKLLSELSFDPNKLMLRHLDLSSSHSIIAFAQELQKEAITVGGLINNASTIMNRFEATDDGYEMTLAVNFISLAQLIHELKPILASNASVVNVNSLAKHPRFLTKKLFETDKRGFRQLKNYTQSKTVTTVYTAKLADKMSGKLRVNLADPGIVNTDLIRLNRWFDPIVDLVFRPFTKSPKKSTIPILNALFAKQSGRQFYGNKNKAIQSVYANHPLKAWLWEETNQQINS